MNTQFSLMQARDLPEVLAIEQLAYRYPWSEQALRESLQAGHYCQLLRCDGELSGYLIAWIVAGECHLLNICVHPAWQRRGMAQILLQRLFETATSLGADAILLEVRAGNMPAIRLYEKLGFNQVGRRRGYYPGVPVREDALLFTRQLI
jgi:ribosomal-protein-alanine N-acetyltransferase